MDPKTAKIDATVAEAYPVPKQASINFEALLASLHKRVPGYLKHFILDESLQSPIPSQAEAMEEDILLLEKVKNPQSGHSARPTVPTAAKKTPAPVGPSAQRVIPTYVETPSAQREVPVYVEEPHSETSPASSETEDFVTVQSKSQKRKLKASKSHDNPPKKVGTAVPAPSHKAATSSQASPVQESEDSPMEEQVREKIPPLYIRDKLHWQRILPLLDRQGTSFTSARSTAIGIRVQCPTSDDHRRLTKTLREENVGFHTYALPDERVLRVVIRGLPQELDTEHIKEDLLSQQLPVREVHRMYHPRNKRPFDMVLVILDHTYEGKRIHRISSVCRLSGLRIEPPFTNGRLGQCHRCQLYGHSARNCFAHPRCVKCLGDHGTSDCSRKQPTEEPPSCVLCRTQGHPANYRGCPRAPKEPKRRVKPVARQPAAPAPTFVPAPAPATNAWARPLLRPNQLAPTPTPMPVPATAAPPAKLVQEKAPMPAQPQPPLGTASPAQSTATDRAPANLRYLRYILANLDLERMDKVVSDMKADPFNALAQHWEYIRFIDTLQKSAP